MMEELFVKVAGGDINGVMQMAVGIIDSLYGGMKPEEALTSLMMARQVIDGLIEKYVSQAMPAPQPEPNFVEEAAASHADQGH